jgi:hypothetical protein
MPYGPHLAVAAVLVVLARPVFVELWMVLVPPVDTLSAPLRFTGVPAGVSMRMP